MIKFNTAGLETYITDEELESVEGIWLKFPEGRRIHILRAGGSNKRYRRALDRAVRPWTRQIQRGSLPMEKYNELMLDIFLESVVIGWDGFEDQNGDAVPFSREAARELFTQIPEMFEEVKNAAEMASLFQEEQAQEAAERMGES